MNYIIKKYISENAAIKNTFWNVYMQEFLKIKLLSSQMNNNIIYYSVSNKFSNVVAISQQDDDTQVTDLLFKLRFLIKLVNNKLDFVSPEALWLE